MQTNDKVPRTVDPSICDQPLTRIELEAIKFVAQRSIPNSWLRDKKAYFEARIEFESKNAILELKAFFACRERTVERPATVESVCIEVEWPATWWQHFKRDVLRRIFPSLQVRMQTQEVEIHRETKWLTQKTWICPHIPKSTENNSLHWQWVHSMCETPEMKDQKA